jgi:hypothetical protein
MKQVVNQQAPSHQYLQATSQQPSPNHRHQVEHLAEDSDCERCEDGGSVSKSSETRDHTPEQDKGTIPAGGPSLCGALNLQTQ